MRIIISSHAYQRAEERLGLSQASFKKLVALGYCYGLQAIETKGVLKRYIQTCFREHGNTDAFIYGENIFILTGSRLVTVYRLPNDLLRLLPKKDAA